MFLDGEDVCQVVHRPHVITDGLSESCGSARSRGRIGRSTLVESAKNEVCRVQRGFDDSHGLERFTRPLEIRRRQTRMRFQEQLRDVRPDAESRENGQATLREKPGKFRVGVDRQATPPRPPEAVLLNGAHNGSPTTTVCQLGRASPDKTLPPGSLRPCRLERECTDESCRRETVRRHGPSHLSRLLE